MVAQSCGSGRTGLLFHSGTPWELQEVWGAFLALQEHHGLQISYSDGELTLEVKTRTSSGMTEMLLRRDSTASRLTSSLQCPPTKV